MPDVEPLPSRRYHGTLLKAHMSARASLPQQSRGSLLLQTSILRRMNFIMASLRCPTSLCYDRGGASKQLKYGWMADDREHHISNPSSRVIVFSGETGQFTLPSDDTGEYGIFRCTHIDRRSHTRRALYEKPLAHAPCRTSRLTSHR